MNFDNYSRDNQMSIFDFTREPISITKPIRLIELFAGYGSQAMALKRIGADFEHYMAVEFDKYAVASYNAVHGTNFPTMDITKVHAEDLRICDTEKYCYLMTYSFPCTDLSVAGKQAGMQKGSGTRSGLLWEVERLLKEIIADNGELPQILFMENVPQVHGKKNMADFQKWIEFLESIGYTNYWQDLNAKNYGVAQNRNRCFMFSFLGDYSYEFPKPISLEKKLKDYLEDEVDEKFYISNAKSEKLIRTLINNGTLQDNNFYPLFGYEGLYEINKVGEIRSVDRVVSFGDGNRKLKGVLLKKLELKNGYYGVNLSKNGKSRMEYVHRLVAINFIPNDDVLKDCINHKDGNKKNNRISNLEWCTKTENMKHAWENDLCHSSPLTGGVRGVARLDSNGNPLELYISIAEATRRMGFKTESSISNCLSGRTKSTHGTFWEYIDVLIDNGTLPQQNLDRQTDRQTFVDGTINNPKKKEVANCVTARYDCGISNLRSVGNLVIRQLGNAD